MKIVRSGLLSVAILASLASKAQAELVITMGGDINLTASRQDPPDDPKTGRSFSWAERYSGLAPLWDGDLNYGNIETVISDQDKMAEAGSPAGNTRTFVFRSSAQGLEYGLSKGLNLISLANNHSADYGKLGMLETQFHVNELKSQYPELMDSGLVSTNQEKAQPQIREVMTAEGKVRVAFVAMTGVLGSNERLDGNGIAFGVLSFYNETDFSLAMKGLREADADIRILSVHWGKEGVLDVQSKQKEWGERALREGNVDLIIGAHPHRVHPIEEKNGKVIFYSLGNYLMRGAKNLNNFPEGHDYGLFSRVYFNYDRGERKWKAQAIEAIPLTDLHAISKPIKGQKAQDRIQFLSRLSRSQFPKTGVQFERSQTGGVACFGKNPGPRAAKLCRN